MNQLYDYRLRLRWITFLKCQQENDKVIHKEYFSLLIIPSFIIFSVIELWSREKQFFGCGTKISELERKNNIKHASDSINR